MATYYFDATLGSDAADGLSIGNAKQNYDAWAALGAAGDTFLFKRGETQVISTIFKPVRSGSSDARRTRYGVYGESQIPFSIWTNPSGTGSMVLNASRALWIDFEDIWWDLRSTTAQGPYCASQTTNPTTGLRFRRNKFTGSTGNGHNINQENTATAIASKMVIEDCEFYDNAVHGLHMIVQDAVVRRCKFSRNGGNAPNGGHGFTSRFNRTSATSAWTNIGGSVWTYPLAAHEVDVYYISTANSSYIRVRRTAGSPTAPGVGEYGVSGGLLHINLNSGVTNPSTQTVTYAWGPSKNILVEQCDSWDNIWDRDAAFQEGHGFAFDDFTEDSRFVGCRSWNNEGLGFSINRGDRNKLIGCIAHDNDAAGIYLGPNDGLQILNSTFKNNNALASNYNAEIYIPPNNKDGVISNNIILGSTTYGINNDPTNTGFTGSNNLILGFTTADRTGFVTGTVTTDPLLNGEFYPAAGSPALAAGTYLGGKDFHGREFRNPPNIGAVQEFPARTKVARSNTSRTNTTRYEALHRAKAT